jgi:radical SAM superfamily enzyme YgiQ (UPF0313 family)
MKILFCIYELDYADHIAIAHLSAIAKKRDHQTFFCALTDYPTVLNSYKPDIVAYSLNVYGYKEMIDAHKLAKTKHNFLSIAGGPQITFAPQDFENTAIDAFCVGEGDLVFDDFLKCVENNESYDNVLNIITKEKINPIRPLISDLNILPEADRDLVLNNSFLKNTPKKTFYATRGCPFFCHYCANSAYRALYKGKGKSARRFSPDRIIDEIQRVRKNYRTEFIKFGDDLFALKADSWLDAFTRRYKKEVDLPFNCYLRIDHVDKDLLAMLKSANCYSVHLSVDSMSEHVREAVLGRHMQKIDVTKTARMIADTGIRTWVNFMLAAPESTVKDDMDIIDFGYKGKVTYLACSTTVPMNGTKLYEYSLQKGILDPTYVGDMTDCSKKSPYKSFSEREKEIRYNIFLLGSFAAKLPNPLRACMKLLIRYIKPNKLFIFVRDKYYKYSIENRIFKLA